MCLRQRVLRYFGQAYEEMPEGCGGCSVCGWQDERRRSVLSSFEEEDEVSSARRATRRGATARTAGRVTNLPSARDLSEEEAEKLFQRLRSLRKRLADEGRLRPYMVFSDATLRAMVRQLPATKDELLEVSGVGKTKLERYGDAFLREINR